MAATLLKIAVLIISCIVAFECKAATIITEPSTAAVTAVAATETTDAETTKIVDFETDAPTTKLVSTAAPAQTTKKMRTRPSLRTTMFVPMWAQGPKCRAGGIIFAVKMNTDCEQYYMTSNGAEPLLFHCPDDYVFDIGQCTCAVSTASKCNEDQVTTTGTEATAKATAGKESTTPKPSTMAKRTKVTDSVTGSTPPVFVDNETDEPTSTATPSTAAPSTAAPSTAAPSTAAPSTAAPSTRARPVTKKKKPAVPAWLQGSQCRSGGSVFAVKKNTKCRKFYTSSSNTRPVLRSCGPGTVFDTKLCTCNWPHATRCRD